MSASPRPLPSLNAVHAAVKAATTAHHEAAERAFARFDLSQPGRYGAFLQAQAAAVRTVETLAEAAGVIDALPDWPARRRLPAILDDLAVLGLSAPPGPDAPFAGDPLGLAYVLEGSRFGARILLRRVLAVPDPARAAATRFLRQPFDAARWATLLDAMRRRGREPGGVEGLTAAAVFAFNCFASCALEQPRPR